MDFFQEHYQVYEVVWQLKRSLHSGNSCPAWCLHSLLFFLISLVHYLDDQYSKSLELVQRKLLIATSADLNPINCCQRFFLYGSGCKLHKVVETCSKNQIWIATAQAIHASQSWEYSLHTYYNIHCDISFSYSWSFHLRSYFSQHFIFC